MRAFLVSLSVTLTLLVNGASAAGFDTIIRNGRVVDGTGSPVFLADVGIADGHIVAIGHITNSATHELDARGLIVAPGFIDLHTHADDVADQPLAENFLRMGVTTIVTGNCGTSRVDVAEFFDSIRRTGVGVNVATLVGQGSVRGQVMGGSFMRPATPAEVERMRELVAQAMKDGAVGLSTGLIYLPGTFAKTDEIVALAKVAAAHGGIYASHMRYETSRIFEALDELVLADQAPHPLQENFKQAELPCRQFERLVVDVGHAAGGVKGQRHNVTG